MTACLSVHPQQRAPAAFKSTALTTWWEFERIFCSNAKASVSMGVAHWRQHSKADNKSTDLGPGGGRKQS